MSNNGYHHKFEVGQRVRRRASAYSLSTGLAEQTGVVIKRLTYGHWQILFDGQERPRTIHSNALDAE